MQCNKNFSKRSENTYQKPHRQLYKLLHLDIHEMPIISVDGFKYFALFINYVSRYSYVSLFQKRYDIHNAFAELINDRSILLSTILSDQRSEYLTETFKPFSITDDIRQEISFVATTEGKDVVGRLRHT